MVRIQLISDIHLEQLNMEEFWRNFFHIDCDILCLCGDIGDPRSDIYWSFIKYVSQKAKYVLIVTGNHDYWGSTILNIDTHIKERLKSYSNVFHLQRNTFVYENYIFLGCTLWSNTPPIYWKDIQTFPDFSQIRNFSPFAMSMMNTTDRKWLENTLTNIQDGLIPIVITHYSPVFNITTSQKYRNKPSQYMFCNDMSYLFPYVHTWMYGHTHYDTSDHIFRVEGHETNFITNQRGYPAFMKKQFINHLIYEPNLNYTPKYFKQNWTL